MSDEFRDLLSRKARLEQLEREGAALSAAGWIISAIAIAIVVVLALRVFGNR
jgi:hypothetical protein